MIRAADSATKLIGIRVARLSAASSRGPASGESAPAPTLIAQAIPSNVAAAIHTLGRVFQRAAN